MLWRLSKSNIMSNFPRFFAICFLEQCDDRCTCARDSLMLAGCSSPLRNQLCYELLNHTRSQEKKINHCPPTTSSTSSSSSYCSKGLWTNPLLPLFFTWKGLDGWSELERCSSSALMCVGLCSRWFVSPSFLPGADRGRRDRGKKARPLPGAAGSRAGLGRLPAPGVAPASMAAHDTGWCVRPRSLQRPVEAVDNCARCLCSCQELNEMMDAAFYRDRYEAAISRMIRQHKRV